MNVFVFLLILAAVSCKTAPEKMAHPAPEITLIGARNGIIIYVITNPPNDDAELLRIADAFFRATVTLDYVTEDTLPADKNVLHSDPIAGRFYRATEYLNRDSAYGFGPEKDLLVSIRIYRGVYRDNDGRYSYEYRLYTQNNFGKADVSPDAWYYRKRQFVNWSDYYIGGYTFWRGRLVFTKEELAAFLHATEKP